MVDIPVVDRYDIGNAEAAYRRLRETNALLLKEIRKTRKAADINLEPVVRQLEATERALQHFQLANAQRKAVLESATQISIIATNIQGIVTVFNKGAENMLGYAAGEIIDRHAPLIFHLPSELALRSRLISHELNRKVEGIDLFFAYATEEQSAYSEWTYVHKNGRLIPVRMSINALRGPEGALEGILCIAFDVSEKKRSDQALRESERKYRLLVRNLPNVVYRGYLDGNIDFFDDKIERLTGYTRDEFMTRKVNWFNLVHKDDIPYAKDILKRALKTDHTYLREYRFVSKKKEVIWVQEEGQIIFGEDGEVEFIAGAFLDITKRKLAENALHESEKNYRSLFNSGPNPIFVLDRGDFEILDANPAAEEVYGYSKSQLLGRPFAYLGKSVSNDLQKQLQAQLPESEDRQRACIVSQKTRHFKKGSHPFYVRITACPTHYHQRPAIIVAVTDITELVEKDAQLVQASKMTTLGQMSAGIAHELNQPLNAIKMGSEFLTMLVETKREPAPRDLQQVAEEISAQVDRATAIISRLREFGRKPDFEKEPVDINAVIRTVTGIIGPQLKLHNIELNMVMADELPLILAQPNRLEQVFFNLLTNAQDAIFDKRKSGGGNQSQNDGIDIKTFSGENRVFITIADTGTGIANADRDKIFEPFFTTKETGKGMGLGLSIVYGIVKEYGGDIEIHRNEAGGTVFASAFPVAD